MSCRNTARGKQGDPGVSSYLYLAYASDASGTGFSLTPSNSLKYIQELVSPIPLTSLTVDDFTGTWVKYIGDNGTNGTNGTNGMFGGITYPYAFLGYSLSGDPGNGKLSFGGINSALTTKINVGNLDGNGNNLIDLFVLLANIPNPIQAIIKIVSPTNSAIEATFTVSSIVAGAGFAEMTVGNLVTSSATPFTVNDPILLTVSMSGVQGDSGTVKLANSLNAVGSNGNGVQQALKTFTIPADTLKNNGESVYIKGVARNLNPAAGGTDTEYIGMQVTNASTSFDYSQQFTSLNESVDMEFTINRVSGTEALITYKVFSSLSGLSAFERVVRNSSWDFSQTMVVTLNALDLVVAPQSGYVSAQQLYVEVKK